MTRRFMAVLCLVLSIAGCVSSHGIDQPLKRARVGDYAIFKGKGASGNLSMRQEVIAIAGEDVTIKTTITANGSETHETQTHKTSKVFDPATEAMSRGEKVINIGKSQDSLKLDGREYKCEIRWYSISFKVNGKEEVAETKVWMSSNAPVYGLVKSQSAWRGQVLQMMELTESGGKK